MNWRAFTIAASLFLLPGSALACGAYPVGVNASDVVIGLVADGSNRIGYTAQSNAGTSRAGMIVYNRTNNTLHVCDGSAWRTLTSPGGTTAAGLNGQVQFNASGILGADSNLYWDNTNKRLGFGTATPIDQLSNNPTDTIDSNSVGTGATAINWNQNGAGYVASVYNANTGTSGNGLLIKGSGTTTNALLSVDTGTAQATAGSPLFRILGNGNVGIGTGTPGNLLDINGPGSIAAMSITGTANNTGVGVQSRSGYGLVQGLTNGNPGTLVLNAFGGNVGIGTTNPIEELDIAFPNIAGGFRIANTSSSAARFPQMFIDHYSGGFGGHPAFEMRAARGSFASPSAVQANDVLGSVAGWGYNGSNLDDGARISFNAEGTFTTTSNPTSIVFQTAPVTSSVQVERMRIDSNGNVGIGTSSPTTKLEVGGVGNASAIKLNRALFNDDNVNFAISNANAGSTLFYNTVGTAASGLAYRFHVTTSNTFAFEIANNRDITAYANAYKPGGGAWTASSDARLKNIDGIYNHGLSSVIKLNTVRYHYKKDNPRKETSDKEFVGLIAQDVQKVFPEAVTTRDDGYLDLDTTPISFAVINAIRELKADNDNLRLLVEEQGREIKALKARQ